MMMSDYLLRRFYAKVRKTDDHWYWTAGTTKGGYGLFWYRGQMRPAHRVSYILHVKDPEDREVHHTCDETLCVRPEHLTDLDPKEHGREHRKRFCIREHDTWITGRDANGYCNICSRLAAKRNKRR